MHGVPAESLRRAGVAGALPAASSSCMNMRLPALSVALLALITRPVIAQTDQQQLARTLRPHAVQWERLLAAEDARATTTAQLDVLVAGTPSAEPALRRIATRALGRLERSSLMDRIARMLADPNAPVRVEAAHALAQSVMRDTAASAFPRVASALSSERDSTVIAALLETTGRLRVRNAAEARERLQMLVPRLASPTTIRLGAARGLYFLALQRASRSAFDDDARSALLRAASERSAGDTDDARRTRSSAVATLGLIGGFALPALARVLDDPHALVRREVIVTIGGPTVDSVAARPLIMRALEDPAAGVRYEALRLYGRRYAAADCAPIRRATQDGDSHVALLAIDLSVACADFVPSTPDGWHYAAHVQIAAARRNARGAARMLPTFAADSNFFVRTYAAQAAVLIGADSVLFRLARDPHTNVRTAAIEGLRTRVGHAADSVYLAQLRQDDVQLLMAAAAALDGSPDPQAPGALLNALDRVSALRRETSRDARTALLERVRQLGNASHAPRVRPYLRDFDPAVASLAADILGAWTGTRPEPAPVPLPRLALPTFAQAAELANSRVIMRMASGDTIELRLLPFEAPTNAWRFARLA